MQQKLWKTQGNHPKKAQSKTKGKRNRKEEEEEEEEEAALH